VTALHDRDHDRVDPSTAAECNKRTVAAYEGYARNYALCCGPEPSAPVEEAMRRLVSVVPRAGIVLEVGSGTGHEADYLESLGLSVRRTDATRAFIEIQAERGRTAHLLNVITDDLGGPYDAVMGLCVLIHVHRDQLPDVVAKIHDALTPAGSVLISMREGTGTEISGPWFTELWRDEPLRRVLEGASLRVVWDSFHIDGDGDRWLTYLASRQG